MLTYTLGLIVTMECNLDCIYCYVPNKHKKVMGLETAKLAVSEFFQDLESKESAIAKIDFLGGEPLCAFSLIQQISEWIWSIPWKTTYYLFATTNGTLLDKEKKEWFYQNKERFILGLSHDGLLNAQDVNRSRSSDLVSMDFFLNTWPGQPFKMTITEHAVSYLSQNIIGFHERRIPFIASLALGMEEWEEENVKEFGRQMMILADYYFENPEIKLSNLFEIHLYQALAFQCEPQRYCGMGKYFYVIDSHGNKAPCHMVSSLTMYGEQLKEAEQFQLWDRKNFQAEDCVDCVLQQMCPICYGMSLRKFGTPFKREKNVCQLFPRQILAVCKYYIKTLVHKTDLSKEEQLLIKAIGLILDHINVQPA